MNSSISSCLKFYGGLERDAASALPGVAALALLRFWTMLAHYHGQIWNASETARSLGISQHVVRQYLDVLEGLFNLRLDKLWVIYPGDRRYELAPQIEACPLALLARADIASILTEP